MNHRIFALIINFFIGFEFGIADLIGNGRGCVWTRPASSAVLGYLSAMNAAGRHIFMRPTEEREPFYVLHDDANRAAVLRYHGFNTARRPAWALPGRLIIETSPGCYQIWVRLDSPATPEEKKQWLDSVGSDPGAAPRRRWGRAPGWRNVKPKYRLPDETFPLARLIWVNATPVESIEALLATQDAPRPAVPLPAAPRRDAPPRRQLPEPTIEQRARFDKGDDSRADMSWCLSLLQRGHAPEAVRAALHHARSVIGWHHHNPADYVERTVRNAVAYLRRK
jgi:hypothetical protein